MPIDRISRLRNFGVYRDFTWPSGLADFGQYNLIYGWNGTGKTTLSRVFRDLESRRVPGQGEVTIRIDGAEVTGDQFPQTTLHVRVYNRDFVTESVFRRDGGDVPPIFVVGRESVEKQKEADRLKQERATTEGQLEDAKRTSQRAERDLDRYCQDQARLIKESLRSPGPAPNQYNNYDKSDLQGRAQKMAADRDADSHRLSQDQQDGLRAQIGANPKPKINEISYRLPDLRALADESATLLEATVVSAAIDALKSDPALANWTRTGLGLHKDKHASNCLFCEQPVPPGRLSALESHFNAEYERFLSRLDARVEALRAAARQASDVVLPKPVELYDDLAQEYTEAERTLRSALDAVRVFTEGLTRELTDKRARLFDSLALSTAAPSVAPTAVDQVNAIIQRHNRACDEFAERIAEARDRLALSTIAGALEEFVRLRDTVQAAHGAITPLGRTVDRLNEEIQRLERDIVEHQQPAEELNEDLKKYLGHGDLQLTIKETGYSITRNGVPADMLSEGEMTAIALLYFLKSLEDRSFDRANGVIVLDDPVSSLDANALFLAFSLMRERTHQAKQLYVLTHNFAFFRQVRNWLRHVPGQRDGQPSRRPSQFYMVECIHNAGIREGRLGALDPLLQKYESEYHYLFACVYRAAHGPSPGTLKSCYHMPNIARRLLESFLAFRHPDVFDNLWGALRGVTSVDDAHKARILNFVQTHSHGPGAGQPEHDLSVLGECQAVLKDLLALIEAEDSAHYVAMKRLADQRDAATTRSASG